MHDAAAVVTSKEPMSRERKRKSLLACHVKHYQSLMHVTHGFVYGKVT